MTNSSKDILKFYKKGIFQDKNSSEDAYLHTILYVPDSFLTTKFHDISFSGLRRSAMAKKTQYSPCHCVGVKLLVSTSYLECSLVRRAPWRGSVGGGGGHHPARSTCPCTPTAYQYTAGS